MINVIPISAFTDNYIWTIVDDESNTAICIDPGESQPIADYLIHNKLSLDAILLTHHHYDHIGGVPELLRHFPRTLIYGPPDSRIPTLTHPLYEHDEISWHDVKLTVINTPGHTSSHISYYSENLGWLFCGDTLFSAGCGRVFDGTIELLFSSLQQLLSLPDETEVYCAHEYTYQNLCFARTIEPENQAIQRYLEQFNAGKITCSLPSRINLEKLINPFFRTNSPAIQKIAQLQNIDTLNPLTIFSWLREEKNRF